jgi:AcrR family transcriptional regulator
MAKAGISSRVGVSAGESAPDNRSALIDAAIETLRIDGFARASARAIAARAGCNQGLVFYYFGSVANLLLAALDAVSAERLARYGAAVERAQSAGELVDVATTIFREDLDAGYAKVLVEMIAGASSTPGLGPEVLARIAPWTQFAQRAINDVIGASALAALVPSEEVAYGVVALYLGLEMLTHLDGERGNALALFERARQLVTFLGGLGAAPASASKKTTRRTERT